MQTPQTDVQITISGQAKDEAFFLPFLGEAQKLTGEQKGGRITYHPSISKGAVFQYQPGE